ncbi:MAG: hypothetical protein R3258_09700 [Acidimicrobiia bacterium]|nr:hypothetical protein [Acidimicrobiia bacterium]
MSHDLIHRMVQEANPVSDPTALETVAPVLHFDQEEEVMDTKVKDEAIRVRKPRRRLMLAGAVTAAVLAVLAIVLPARNQQPVAPASTTVPDPGPSTTVDPAVTASRLADNLVAALVAFDIGLAESYLAENATISLGDTGGNDLAQWMKWHQAVGSEFTLTAPCSLEQLGLSYRGLCQVEYNNAWGKALGVGPFDIVGFGIGVVDGAITSVTIPTIYTQAFRTQAGEVFFNFLEANDYQEPDLGEGIDWSLTDEGIEAYRRWTEEFVAAQG